MDKIIVVDKPQGKSSFDVLRDIKKQYNTGKVGHCGTLDPMATGVLVVALNKALKLVQFLDKDDKEYIGTGTFGIKTDTGDITGTTIEEKPFDIKKEDLVYAMQSFVGKYMQKIPMYSAKKIDGKKLYEYARNGQEIEVAPKEVEVKEIELLEFDGNVFKFRTVVSKGTFIRTLIEDIAQKLDTVATMSALRRTRSGKFDLSKTEWEMDESLSLPVWEVSEKDRDSVIMGAKLSTDKVGTYQIMCQGKLIAVVDCQEGKARILRGI